MNLPPLLLRELPEDLRRRTLEELVQEGSRDLCGRLYERCLLLLGSGHCGANDPIWRQACERFGLRRLVRADWRANFDALCQEMKNGLTNNNWAVAPAHDTFFLYVQGRAKEVEVNVEKSVLKYLAASQLPLLREAFLGLGATEYPTVAALSNLRNALVSGDVDLVKAAIGTGLNAGVSELCRLVFSIGRHLQGDPLQNTVEGYLEWIQLLLEAGVRTDFVELGDTVLLRAVLNGRKPTHRVAHAEWWGYTRLVQLLLEHGVDPNNGGRFNPPLCFLVKRTGFFRDSDSG